jgi:Spy/CpxP family protein refolding chaperone
MTAASDFVRRPAVRAGALLALVFVAGMVAGTALDRTFTPGPLRALQLKLAAPPDVSQVAGRVQYLLDLNEEQTAKVRALLERRQPQIQSAWGAARVALRAQVDTTLAELATILTPEQHRRLLEHLRTRGFLSSRGRP